MAIAGKATPAYNCQVQANELVTSKQLMVQNSICAEVIDAIDRLSRGEVVTVRGADMFALRRQLAMVGVQA